MKVSTAQEAINGNSNDTVITPLRLKQVLNTKEIGGGGSTGNETDPIFKASPASKITQSNINAWNDKQNKLVSGQNIKTINGQNILGEGNIDIEEGTGGVIEETDPTVPQFVKEITQEDIKRWNQNNDGEMEFDISSAIDTIYEGILLGGESVVLENHKRFLDVYFVVSLSNHRMFSKYTIDTTLTEPCYGGTTFPSSDSSSGVSSYVSEGKWEASNNTFTHFRTGYFNIEENKFYERNARETYYIYRIDTYDDPLLEIKLPDVNVDLDDISSKMSKVIYDNPTGTNTTVNLSEPSANFKYIEIFFRDNDNTHSSVRVYEPDGKFVDLTTLANWSKMLYVKQSRFQISGSTISPASYSEVALTSSPSTSIQTTTNMIYITKVVGYYDENVLIVGNNGTEIVNTNKPKNIITAYLSKATSMAMTAWEAKKVPLDAFIGNGDKLKLENGSIVVGEGVNQVRINASIRLAAEFAASYYCITIKVTKKDGTVLPVIAQYQQKHTVQVSNAIVISPYLENVSEGDIIDLLFTSSVTQTQSLVQNQITSLTVEVVEDGQIITVNNTIDGIPIGSEFEYDGEEVPDGYEKVDDDVITVDNVVSRNLFNKNNANIVIGYSSASEIISGSYGRLTYISCKPNTTYTIQKKEGVRFVVSCSESKPELGVPVTRLINAPTQPFVTVKTNSNAKYLIVDYYDNDAAYDVSEQSILDSIQIEEGSTATSYVPYLNLEEAMREKDPTCYYDGDTYVIPANAYINVGGCITASKSQIRFGIFVYKSLKNIKSIIVNYAKLTIRYPDGGYIISEVDVTNYLTPSNEGENVIYFEYRPSSAMSPTNNTPVSVEINGLNLTFKE